MHEASVGQAVFFAWGLLLGCSASLHGPNQVVEAPRSAFVEVPYPPPAALVEEVPSGDNPPNTVWLDGSWTWQGSYYVWQRGGWFTEPKDAVYVNSKYTFAPDGRILFAPSGWYDSKLTHVIETTASKPARTPPNEITVESEVPRQ